MQEENEDVILDTSFSQEEIKPVFSKLQDDPPLEITFRQLSEGMVHLKNEAFMLTLYQDMAEWAVDDQVPNVMEDDRSSDQQIEE
jgi:hypothetical protein